MNIEQAIAALRKFKSEITTLAGNEMVNDALDNLEAEKDIRNAPLKPRKPGSPRNVGRRILKDTGDGDRSIRVSRKTDRIVEISANEYMAAHNEGEHIKATAQVRTHTRKRKGRTEQVKAHSRKVDIKLPQRQFAGPSPALYKRITDTLLKRFNTLTK